MNKKSKRFTVTYFYLFVIVTLIISCVHVPSAQQRRIFADQLVTNHQWQAQQIVTSHFDLMSYQLQHYPKDTLLSVYIEGDGLAWLNKNTLSTDPSPITPIGLELALNQPEGNVVYLARPCQYTGGTMARNCNKSYWSDSRFGEEVITSINEALKTLKMTFHAQQLQLIGYSGGGAVAALVAARRDDVVKLITVAGNLDHQAWTTYHRISPLSNSLNPVHYRQPLASIEQIHFVGTKDKIIPPFLAEQYAAGFDPKTKVKVVRVPEFDHHCCWVDNWARLYSGEY